MPSRTSCHSDSAVSQSDKEFPVPMSHSENLSRPASHHNLQSYGASSFSNPGHRVSDFILPKDIAAARLLIRRDRNSYFQDVGETLVKLRKQGRASDCTVVCNKARYPAHRVLLAGYCEKLLYGKGWIGPPSGWIGPPRRWIGVDQSAKGMDWSAKGVDQSAVDVPADGVQAHALEMLLKYLYTSKLTVKYDTVMDVLVAARTLNLLPELAEACENFLVVLFVGWEFNEHPGGDEKNEQRNCSTRRSENILFKL
ncbi:hypothetical protein BV898_04468 [Hypsibius exemplaris]|uniref:BTB domain-containing protein n=1 Tax=Hypsibius exemplaris TaxID=2072580 RepID=A0A1W0X269_HYPEX|nr:hypothetical protein BV898_04468 [Hypsibius exemplaris]